MNDKKLNFEHRQEEELDTSHHQRREGGLEFDSAEEMLRQDAENVEVPAAVAERIAETVRNDPPSGPWWKRVFK